jgi:hypothetical protein
VSFIQDHRIEFAMAQPPNPVDVCTDFDHHIVLFPTRPVVDLAQPAPVPTGFPAVSPAVRLPARR